MKTGKKHEDRWGYFKMNPQQQKIIENGDGVVIVNAGPGTGKTKTLTSRIVYLIKNKNVTPRQILALTFTNRAAGEMRDRLKPWVGIMPYITTFHGLCYDLLKNWGEEFEIILEEERDKLIKKIIKEHKIKISRHDFSTILSQVKNSTSQITLSSETSSIVNIYNEELAESKRLDFDDLIMKTWNILKNDETKRSALQKKYRYILVDEFQDSNDLQYELIKLLLNKERNLFVIGDPLQSIYGFRGANPHIFERLKKDFVQARDEFLEINYRSHSQIVEFSKCVFPELAKINAFSQTPGTVGLIETLNEYSEADWIVRFINEIIGGSELLNATDTGENKLVDFSHFAIIYRTHALAHILEKQLSGSGFPYQIIKEDSVLEGHHIKLLSIHAVKGLEFDYVFICGFEDGLIPHERRSKGEKKVVDLEEEKRLLYVAMTRAKKELYLLYAKKRNNQATTLSRFHPLFKSKNLVKILDSATDTILKKRELYKIKKSQMSLF